MRVLFNVQIWRERKMYVAYVPELDVSSCGKTPEEARKNIDEAAELFLEEAKKMGTLVEILQEAGFEKHKKDEWEAPEIVALEKKELVVV